MRSQRASLGASLALRWLRPSTNLFPASYQCGWWRKCTLSHLAVPGVCMLSRIKAPARGCATPIPSPKTLFFSFLSFVRWLAVLLVDGRNGYSASKSSSLLFIQRTGSPLLGGGGYYLLRHSGESNNASEKYTRSVRGHLSNRPRNLSKD
ncbi:hypothetical protein BGW36DRAFT_192548 [Talaromyces proteolyticus]|uniref:Uncharacterized protein n=1 Tax=Talaromyces proteolyticus TaxID=1131652 RepID=A0AAD4KM06_9EURO|nr:uncharacterized protein BGW36DRAFT_192548 [Talaromyces proteolyticus]KAH8694891.1 hypothetical protein BGW36DRAFT_192548 [Talaromyces proteolyticus]